MNALTINNAGVWEYSKSIAVKRFFYSFSKCWEEDIDLLKGLKSNDSLFNQVIDFVILQKKDLSLILKSKKPSGNINPFNAIYLDQEKNLTMIKRILELEKFQLLKLEQLAMKSKLSEKEDFQLAKIRMIYRRLISYLQQIKLKK